MIDSLKNILRKVCVFTKISGFYLILTVVVCAFVIIVFEKISGEKIVFENNDSTNETITSSKLESILEEDKDFIKNRKKILTS